MLYMRSGSDNWVITRIHKSTNALHSAYKIHFQITTNFIPPKFKTKTNNPNSSNSNAKQLIKTPKNYKPKKKIQINQTIDGQQKSNGASSGVSIKRELLDEHNERLSPSSTGSYSSGVSVSHASVPIADIVRQHHQHDTHQPSERQRHHHHQQQQSHHPLNCNQLLYCNTAAAFAIQQQRHSVTRPTSPPSAASTNDLNDMLQTNTTVPTSAGYLLPCPLCDAPLEPRLFRQHLDRHYPRDSPVCPVLQCGRRFAHPNSVRNHMRIKHTLQWAKMKAMRSSGGPFSGMPDFK